MRCGRRLSFALLALVLCGGCVERPSPDEQKERVEAWLALLAAGRDEQARDQIAGAAERITVERFTEQVDRLPVLRRASRVSWIRVAPEGRGDIPWARQTWWVEATLHDDRGAHAFECRLMHRGALSGVRVDHRALMPPVVVSPAPRDPTPPPSLGLRDPVVGFDGQNLRLRGRAVLEHGPATIRLDGRCRHGARWFRAALDRPITVTAPGLTEIEGAMPLEDPAPAECALQLSILQRQTQGDSFCWRPSGLEPGPCPERPQPTPSPTAAPLSVSEVRVEGGAVRYLLAAHRPLPVRYAPDGAFVRTLIECPDGARDEHVRPITAEWLEPGEHRRLGSVFSPSAWPAGFPPGCTIALVYQTRAGDRVPLWEGSSAAP